MATPATTTAPVRSRTPRPTANTAPTVVEKPQITGWDFLTPEEQALWEKRETRDFGSSTLELGDGPFNVTFDAIAIVGKKGHYVKIDFTDEDKVQHSTVVMRPSDQEFLADAIVGSVITVEVANGYLTAVHEYTPPATK